MENNNEFLNDQNDEPNTSIPQENDNSINESVYESEDHNEDNAIDGSNVCEPSYENPNGTANDVCYEKSSQYSQDMNIAPVVDYSNSFTTIEKTKTSVGIKIFAFVLAIIIVAVSGLTAGYYFGSNKSIGTGIFNSVDLASKPKDTDESTPAQIYEIGNKSVVGITCYNTRGQGSEATGVIYTEDGYIVTNDHIYREVSSPKFKVYTFDGKEYNAEYVAGDTRTDIAILKVVNTSDKFNVATFGNSNECFVGENVVAIGRPMDAKTSSNLTNGIISLLGARVTASNNYSIKSIQTNSAINPGSSGGALFNMYGQVVGITFSKIAGDVYEGIGYAIPSVTVKRVADSLIKNGYVVDRARLGISYYDIDSVTAEVENIPSGLQVTSIDAESKLYGKLNVGDTITHVNDIKITTTDIILDIIENSKPGDSVSLTYVTTTGSTNSINTILLEDKGSSSYIKNGGQSNSSESSNNSEFTFPFGE